MSEGITSTTKMWRGIPLSHVRSGFFIDKLGTVNTLMKLIINQDTTEFSSAEDGSVTLDGSYLNWMFISPIGRFQISDFSNKSVAEFFEIMSTKTRTNYVKAWEEFILFINGNVSTVNAILSKATSATLMTPDSVVEYPLSAVPSFSSMASFSDFMLWIEQFIPNTLKTQPATILQSNVAGGQYTYTVILCVTLQDGEDQQNAAMTFSFVI